MAETSSVVAVDNSHTDAENAVKDLQRSGFPTARLSIVGKDYQTTEHVVGYYNTGDRMKFLGKLGASWGGLCGDDRYSHTTLLASRGPFDGVAAERLARDAR